MLQFVFVSTTCDFIHYSFSDLPKSCFYLQFQLFKSSSMPMSDHSLWRATSINMSDNLLFKPNDCHLLLSERDQVQFARALSQGQKIIKSHRWEQLAKEAKDMPRRQGYDKEVKEELQQWKQFYCTMSEVHVVLQNSGGVRFKDASIQAHEDNLCKMMEAAEERAEDHIAVGQAKSRQNADPDKNFVPLIQSIISKPDPKPPQPCLPGPTAEGLKAKQLMGAQDERDKQQQARNHWQMLKNSITTGPGPAQWRDHLGPAQFSAKTGRWTGTILHKGNAGSAHPIGFCAKTCRWKDHLGRFCKSPDDVIKLEDYLEPPLSPGSYDPGRIVFLQKKKAKDLRLTGIIRASIVRSTDKSVFVRSESFHGDKMFRKSSVLRAHKPEQVKIPGFSTPPSEEESPCHTPILYTSDGEIRNYKGLTLEEQVAEARRAQQQADEAWNIFERAMERVDTREHASGV